MRKITPMILVTLMLVSALSSFDFAELEETEVIEDAGARAGADAEMVAITNPKETICPFQAPCRNVMKVGDVTDFTSYIKNVGDADITEMSYTVEVWISDPDGNAIMLAKDLNNNDLTWTNADVICGSSTICDYQSLAAGAVLGGGKHTMSKLGSPIQWTPLEGNYVIKMTVTSSPDASAGNNAQQVFVTVEDWYDIELDLAWDSGNDLEIGTGSKAWTLTVIANSSDNFDPREVNVRIQSVGDGSAVDLDGNSITSSTTHIYTAGTSTLVEVTRDASTEPPVTTNASRAVLSVWKLQGILTVDAGESSTAAYGMKATLINYTQYGQFENCGPVSTDPNNTVEESGDSCEQTFTDDAYSSTDSTSIDGSATIFHDIRISRMAIFQGYESNGDGEPNSMTEEGFDGDLNVGTSYLWVEVEHRGSDQTSSYDWSVNFSVTDSTGDVTTISNVTTCTAVQPPRFDYMPLGFGIGEDSTAPSCAMIVLDMDGEHTFSALLVNDNSKLVDAKPSNNLRSFTLNVQNNDPIITSLELVNTGEIVSSQQEPISLVVSVFDVDDASGLGLEIEWAHSGAALPGCARDDNQGMNLECNIFINPSEILNYAVSVTVYDSHGGQNSEEIMLEIWNDGSVSNTTLNGLFLFYELIYWDTTEFSFDLTDGEAITNQALPGYSGMYDSVSVMDYQPSTAFDASKVLSQSLLVEFDKSLGATSLWYVNSGSWALLSDTPLDSTNSATVSRFSYVLPSDMDVLTPGSIVLMGGSLAQAEVPSASITGFNSAAGKAGVIQLNWDVAGTMLAGDTLDVSICETINCTSAFKVSLGAGNSSYTYAGQNTVHGVNYTVSVAVCNEVGCSTPVGLGYVVSDKKVDGGAMATGLKITASGTTWTVSWNASGDQGDVASWNVCHRRGTFTAGEIGMTTCVNVVGTSVDLDTSTWDSGTYTAYVAAMPVDALGNSDTAGAMNSADFERDSDTTNPDDGTIVVGDDVKSGVPTWTWGVIGGVVVIAFIAGAFILSRGGAGDEGKDWDY